MDPSSSARLPDTSVSSAVTALVSLASAALIGVASFILIKAEILDNGGRQQWWHLAPALFLGLPYLVTTWLALRAGAYATFVFARAQAVLGVIAGIPLSLLAIPMAALGMGDRDPVNLMFAVWFFTALQIVLIVSARAAKRALAATVPADTDTTLVAMAPMAWLLVAAIGIGVTSAAGKSVRARAFADADLARAAVRQVAGCLIEAHRRDGAYPARIVSLTPGCAQHDFSTGEYAGHAISYRRDDRAGFVLLAVPHAQMSRDKRSHLADGSGRVYTVREGIGYDKRPVFSSSYEDIEAANQLSLVRCLALHAAARSEGDFPERLDQQKGCISEIRIDGPTNTYEGRRYRLVYRPTRDAAGRRTGFQLEVRPKEYGGGGIRSYFADESQIIRGTGENRAATTTDPEVWACERPLGYIGTCDQDLSRRGTPLTALLGRRP